MREVTSRTLEVLSADEFRDMLPNSGVFGMLDCEVEVVCPPAAEVPEIEKMVMLLESMINVTDVRIVGIPRSEEDEHYIIKITEVSTDIAKGKTKR